MIEKYIRQLLHEHDCVVIPDFGGFIAKYAPATVHPARHTFSPPSKAVAFNEMLRLNDGLLISHVAVGEGVSREEAARLVRDFAEYVRGQIWQSQKYTFAEIGTLSLNPEQKMEFEPLNRINFLNAGFGLPEMAFSPIERHAHPAAWRGKDRAPVPHTRQEGGAPVLRRNRQLWYALGFTGLMAVSAFTGYFLFSYSPAQALGSFNPLSLLEIPSEEDPTVQATEKEIAARRARAAALPPDAWAAPQPTETELAAEWPPVAPPAETPKAETRLPERKAETRPAEKPAAEPAKPEAGRKAVAEAAAVRYYVIVNGFSVDANATRFRRMLAQTGQRKAKILPRGVNGLIKVSAADYASRAEAEAKAAEMKRTYPAAWVFETE